jgi:hypothetical protein
LTDFLNDWVDSAPYITLSVIAIHSLSKGGFRWAAVTGWKHRENIEELPYPWPFAIAGAYTFGHQPNMWNCMKVLMETQTLLVRLWPLRAKADVDPKTIIITDQSISMQYKDRAFRFKVKFKFQSFHRPRMRCTDLYSGPICLHYTIVERTKTRWLDIILSAISASQSFFNHQFYLKLYRYFNLTPYDPLFCIVLVRTFSRTEMYIQAYKVKILLIILITVIIFVLKLCLAR